MDASRCHDLVTELEFDPDLVPAYYGELESSIDWLMQRTFDSKDSAEKTRLVMVEMRARLVLERWKKQNRN